MPWLLGINATLSTDSAQTDRHIPRVGQNLIYTPYMTVCMVISLL